MGVSFWMQLLFNLRDFKTSLSSLPWNISFSSMYDLPIFNYVIFIDVQFIFKFSPKCNKDRIDLFVHTQTYC